jgi:ATP-dependent RNA helicase RhlE
VATLARTLLTDPVKVEVAPQATPADRINQSVLFVDKLKKDALLESILSDKRIARALVFTRTKHRASRVAKKLARLKISADAIHGDKAQGARTRALGAFRSGAVRVLVATDIAARGIDVDGITHVINYELPNEPESYVHRIGRTARAGNDGAAISFCSGDERDYLNDIEKTIRLSVKIVRSHPLHSAEAEKGLVNGEDGPAARKRSAANRFAPRRDKPAGKSRAGGNRPRSSQEWRPSGGKKRSASGAGQGKPRGRTRRGSGNFQNG